MLEKLLGKKKQPKVLIVEDDSLLSSVLMQSFEAEKFKVLVVGNGLRVIDNVGKFQPDIILLDLLLPGMDGFAILKKLKSDSKYKKIPVVVISNLGDEGDVRSTKVLGAEEHFIKANTNVSRIVKFVKTRLKV